MYVYALGLTMCLMMAVLHHAVLINHSNELYCDSPIQDKQWPQPYEEVQLKEPEPDPEYSYAAHGVDMNTYDSVAHDENVGCDAGNPRE